MSQSEFAVYESQHPYRCINRLLKVANIAANAIRNTEYAALIISYIQTAWPNLYQVAGRLFDRLASVEIIYNQRKVSVASLLECSGEWHINIDMALNEQRYTQHMLDWDAICAGTEIHEIFTRGESVHEMRMVHYDEESRLYSRCKLVQQVEWQSSHHMIDELVGINAAFTNLKGILYATVQRHVIHFNMTAESTIIAAMEYQIQLNYLHIVTLNVSLSLGLFFTELI